MTDNETKVTLNKDGSRRKKRATPEEMVERKRRELEIAELRAAGKQITASGETYGAKMIRAAIRKRKTALGRAETVLSGKVQVTGDTIKVLLKNIDQRIEDAQDRVANLRQHKAEAEKRIADLPFDIESLEKVMATAEEAIENGEEPVYALPEGLSLLPGEKTPDELESIAATEGTEGSDD